MPELIEPTARLHAAWLEAHQKWGPGQHEDGFGLDRSDEVDSPAGFGAWLTRREQDLHGLQQAGGDADTRMGATAGPQPARYRQIDPGGPAAALIRVLEIGQAEADWARKEDERRSEIREDCWKEVKEAFVHVAYERNIKRLSAELGSRDTVAAMRAYADEIDARATGLENWDAQAACEWAGWIGQHADRTDPLNGRLCLIEVTSCSHEELQPHMHGWSTHGPYRQ